MISTFLFKAAHSSCGSSISRARIIFFLGGVDALLREDTCWILGHLSSIVIVSNLALSGNDGPEMGVYHLVQSSIRVDYSIALLSDPKSKIMGG